ncbi:type II toxin-antitoxin system HicB family antitoxin [Halomarina pelagica]|uniref:type II toxin-antitoxin system HicB family antitoxin n=1 Tax=Halomarina pelagica TaxID=2961599 RepID=UPI0020C43124|nr:hypothetical protein [Halomarina sp. BND7]
MSATVEISEENGEYTAVDSETGATGIGKTRAMALAALAVRLGAEENRGSTDERAELRALAERTRRRFEREEVSEDDVKDAISWARSE